MSPVPALTLFFLLFALSAHARPQRYLPLGRLPGDVNPFDRYLQRCGENREFHECGTVCPDTCEDYLKKPRLCTMQCVIGCQCKKGFVLKGETCVRPEECKGSRKGYLQAGLLPPRLSKLYWQGNPPLVPGAPIWYLQDGLPPPVVNPIGVSKQGDPPLGPPPNANPIGYLGNYAAAEPPGGGALPPRPLYMGPIVLPPLGDPKLYLQGIFPLDRPWSKLEIATYIAGAAREARKPRGSPRWYLQDGLPPPVVNPIGTPKTYLQVNLPTDLGNHPPGFFKSYLQEGSPGGPLVMTPKGDPKLYLKGIFSLDRPWSKFEIATYIAGAAREAAAAQG